MRDIRMLRLLPALMLALLLLPAVAHARLGVGSTLPKITVDSTHPGFLLELPVVPIYNTGDEAATYQMNTFSLSATQSVDPEWITYSPKTFRLKPNQSQNVKVTVDIPANAEPRVYKAILAAQVVNPGTGVVINAALGPRFTMTVKKSNILWTAYGYLDRRGPWSYYILAVAVLLILAIPTSLLVTRSRAAAFVEGEPDAVATDGDNDDTAAVGDTDVE